MWPKFCADHQEVKVLWCLECSTPVCQGCALGQGGAHCSHITSRPGQSGAVATRTALSRRAVGYWGPRTNLLGKMVGAMDGGVRLIWGTGEAEGMAWLEGTHGAVVQLKLAMKKEMKEQEARKGKGGGGPGEELGSGGRGSGGTLGSGKSGKRKSRRARGGPAGGPAGGSTGGATRGATGGASGGTTGGATETSIQSKLPECPVRIRRKQILFLSSKIFQVCFEQFSGQSQVYQCSLGHFVCGDCRPRVRTCPSCRGSLIGRCHGFEEFLQILEN